MNFVKPNPPESKGKKRPPPLPPRDEISEDSLEDEISEVESQAEQSQKNMNEKASKRTIDVETILRQAEEGLDESNVSSTYQSLGGIGLGHGMNKLPLPEPLNPALLMNDQYLNKFRNTKTFNVYKVITDFYATEDRHLSAQGGDTFNGFSEEGNWVCGFKDTSPGKFGFLPKNYLKFDHSTNSNKATPNNRSRGQNSNSAKSPGADEF